MNNSSNTLYSTPVKNNESINNNYENKENFNVSPRVVRRKSKSPGKSPLSPQPMVLSPKNIPHNNNNNCNNDDDDSMVMSPPKSNNNNGFTNMGPPTMMPKKTNIFESVSRAQSHAYQQQINCFSTPSTPSTPTLNLTTTTTQSQQISASLTSTPTLSRPVSATISSTNGYSSIRNKTLRKSLKEEDDELNSKKREDRKSTTLYRSMSKRDIAIHLSRQKTEAEVRAEIEQRNQIEREKKRIEAIKEVLSSEQTYVNHLNNIIDSYLLPLRRDHTTPEEVKFIVSIFSNIEGIREVNNTILKSLKQRIGNGSAISSDFTISDLFLQSIPLLSVYTEYYVNWYRSIHNLDIFVSKCKKFKKFLEDRNQTPMNLKSLLIMPCQRIPRYTLLIDAIVKLTLPDHPDYQSLLDSLEKMKNLTISINVRVGDSEKVQLVTNIRYKFDESIGFLDEVHRRLIKESINVYQLLPYKSIVSHMKTLESNNNNDDGDDSTDEEEYTPIFSTSFNGTLGTPSKKSKKSKSKLNLIPSDCFIYLFNDMFVVGVPNNINNLNSGGNGMNSTLNRVILKCNLSTMFIKDYANQECSTIFSIHHPNGTFLINTPSQEIKDEWINEINGTILTLINGDKDLLEKRNHITIKGSDQEGWYAIDSTQKNPDLIQKSLSEMHDSEIFTPKKRKSMIGKVKQRMSSALLSPHKNQNVKRNSSFVLNLLSNE
ncbi:hypothetical protein CYY_002466 [Polysphondylium violaceum]|uniref:DH domain-containing protein n=1 Tax=Polysphondylium violaceum TaxID=133409 RepID=A0A8J4PYW8_9MYCE|nr:hypothetical protein CYY_002466 [Polysphondylium violaceum]